MSSNRNKTLKCLQEIVDYSEEIVKNMMVTIQVFQLQIFNSHDNRASGDYQEVMHSKKKGKKGGSSTLPNTQEDQPI